jgi:branched-chain amino acid transport system substrate-binding protein
VEKHAKGYRPGKRRWRILVTVGAVAIIAVGCSSTKTSSSSKATTGNSSILGVSKPATGPPILAGLISDGQSQAIDNSSEIPAAQAAVKYINDHLGGVAGHVLELKTCTDNQTPSGATDCVNQMIAAHVVAVMYGVSGQGDTIFKDLQPAHIPLFVYGALDQSTLLSKTAFVVTNGLGSLAAPPYLLQQSGGKRGAVVVINVPAATGPVQQIAPIFYKNAGATVDTVAVPPGVADMTPQIQAELNKNPDQVAIIGNDTFCISAIKALRTVGYSKPIVVIPTCVSDASRKALGSQLNGIVEITSASTDPAAHEVALYDAVMGAYAPSTAPNGSVTAGGYAVVLSFARAMTGLSGPVTPASVLSTAVAMQPQPLPLADGLTFQCNQKQVSFAVGLCSTGFLQTTLDSAGQPTTYKPLDLSAILKL